MSDIKKELHALCISYVQERIDAATQAIKATQQAANEETKSSAGDKYETGRAMMQQETDRNQAQLNEANKLMMALKQISIITTYTTVEPGSLVSTDSGKFFIAISAGTFTIDGTIYHAVSPGSPIGMKLKGQKTGGEFNLNGKLYRVDQIT
jgi:hypothetical protein